MIRTDGQFDLIVEQARQRGLLNLQRQESGLEASTDSRPQRFRVKSEQNDYLTCRTWDGSAQGTVDVFVAKPPNLRGNTATRTSGTKAESIFPAYTVDGDLWADRPMGGTDVTTAPEDAVWLDKNVDARNWTEEKDCDTTPP